MRKSDFLTLKGPDGELARLTNMEVSVDFVHQKTNGAVFVSMHEQIPGYYAADSVAHTSDVIGVGYYSASGTEISGTLQVKTGENNETNKGFNDWWTRQVERDGQRTTSIAANAYKNADGAAIHPSDGEKLRLTVKAVGTKITVKVTSLDNNTVYEDREIDNGSSGQEGTLSIGVGAGSRFVQCITVRQLDDSGNPVDFGSKAVTVDAGDGTLVGEEKIWVVKNATLGDLLPIPTRNHYAFDGWYTAADNSGTKFEANTPVTKDTALYAHWRRIVRTVKFGETEILVNDGDTIGADNMPADPTREDYDFIGWFDGETRITADTVVTGDINATAKWKEKDVSQPSVNPTDPVNPTTTPTSSSENGPATGENRLPTVAAAAVVWLALCIGAATLMVQKRHETK